MIPCRAMVALATTLNWLNVPFWLSLLRLDGRQSGCKTMGANPAFWISSLRMMQTQNTHRQSVFRKVDLTHRQAKPRLRVVEERKPLAAKTASLVMEVKPFVPSLSPPCPFEMVLCMTLDVGNMPSVRVGRPNGSCDDNDGNVPSMCKPMQDVDVSS